MKCVKNLETEEVIRMFDDRAIALVKSGKYSFSPKKEWKDKGRKK